MVLGLTPVLAVAVGACALFAFVCWLLSVLTREYSWTDRMWSIAPALYVIWFAAWSSPDSAPRLITMAVLASLWSARLTYNFARKGGYSRGGEDYRWVELRRRMSPAAFQVLNVIFIALFQNVILLLLALSAWVALRHPSPLDGLDILAAILFLGFLAGETVADEQQWRFQMEKNRRNASGEPVETEFLTTGLFRYSRHPNFFCEQGLWWSFYLFSVAAGGGWLNVSIVGPVILTLLFQGSTSFTESITLAKYPAYADYRRTTSRLIPWWPRRQETPT